MKDRFEGDSGHRLLLDAILDQELVAHNDDLAAVIIEQGELIEYTDKQLIISQGDSDNHILFIAAGTVDIEANGRKIAQRQAGQAVGEMALIDATQPRSASVVANGTVVALKVYEPSFESLSLEHPIIYKNLARSLANKVREKLSLFLEPNEQPILFLGSSTEALPIADQIQLGLKHDRIEVRKWTDSVFGPSGITIDTLFTFAQDVDFAALLLTPDDVVSSRGSQSLAPRDNVIFELGLFMGRLGRERVFLILDTESDPKIPTDLLGLTPITYNASSGTSLSSAIATVCTELRQAIARLGVK